jgi:hypothetical protein
MAHEFKIVVEGVELDKDQERLLRDELQKVALKHIAQLDFGGDRGALILPLPGRLAPGQFPNGGTQGIIARVLEGERVQQLLGE